MEHVMNKDTKLLVRQKIIDTIDSISDDAVKELEEDGWIDEKDVDDARKLMEDICSNVSDFISQLP